MHQSLITLIILLANTHGMEDIGYSSYDYKDCEDCLTYIQWYEASGKHYHVLNFVVCKIIESFLE